MADRASRYQLARSSREPSEPTHRKNTVEPSRASRTTGRAESSPDFRLGDIPATYACNYVAVIAHIYCLYKLISN